VGRHRAGAMGDQVHELEEGRHGLVGAGGTAEGNDEQADPSRRARSRSRALDSAPLSGHIVSA
jgi:hypothetical protein